MNWTCILDPQPTYRQMGDIDFLVPSEHFDLARLLMLEQNYKPLDEDDFRHIEFQKNGVLFELHRAFAIFNDPERAKLLDDLLKRGLGYAKFSTGLCMWTRHYRDTNMPALLRNTGWGDVLVAMERR